MTKSEKLLKACEHMYEQFEAHKDKLLECHKCHTLFPTEDFRKKLETNVSEYAKTTNPILSSGDLNKVMDWRIFATFSGTNNDGQNILNITLSHDENGSKKFRDLVIVDSGEVFLSEEY